MLLLVDTSDGVLVTEDKVNLVGTSTLVRSKHNGLIGEMLNVLISLLLFVIAPID